MPNINFMLSLRSICSDSENFSSLTFISLSLSSHTHTHTHSYTCNLTASDHVIEISKYAVIVCVGLDKSLFVLSSDFMDLEMKPPI